MGDLHEAVEVLAGDGPVVLTCEHASVAMPAPWVWPVADRWLVGTHWSYDPGAADLTRRLAEIAGWPAVMSRFSRLLVDPNRPLHDPTLFRAQAEGRVIHLNAGVSPADRERRIERFWAPYHEVADRVVGGSAAEVVCGVHSFTPVYEGHRREVEVGVLFNDDEDLARRVATPLLDAGYHVRLNEPWSGRDGLIYGPERHARAHGRLALEIEVRQDLAADPDWLSAFAEALRGALDDALR